MATGPLQARVADYHRAMSEHTHHSGGHDMFLFHGNWHVQNPDPTPPGNRNPSWGSSLVFGTNFLQMHHEMVKAADSEQKFHMLHPSIVSWFLANHYDLPAPWNPLDPIPADLRYEQDITAFPQELQQAIPNWAAQRGMTPEQFLTRVTDAPAFTLPKWFTREGVGPGEDGEPYTGAKKLADFRNTNQLGCCIVFPHNRWHSRIGGAMSTTWTAIADPIFYFGVHWYIDRVFDEYKLIQSERSIRRFDFDLLRESNAVASEPAPESAALTAEQQKLRKEDIAISESLRPALF